MFNIRKSEFSRIRVGHLLKIKLKLKCVLYGKKNLVGLSNAFVLKLLLRLFEIHLGWQ